MKRLLFLLTFVLVLTACDQLTDANFKLLITDAPSAIDDFESLEVHIVSVRFFTSDHWEEREVDETVDLTLVVNNNSAMVLTTILPEGVYKKVELQVEDAVGIVEGEEVTIKIPSNKLLITKSFTIVNNTMTAFVFDIQVVKKGNGDYNLIPNIAKSGVIDGAESDDTEPEEQLPDYCEGVDIEFSEHLCYNNGDMRAYVKNTGDKKINGLQIITLNPQLREIKKDISIENLNVGDSYAFVEPFDRTGKIHIEIVPYVDEGAIFYCLEKRLVADVLPNCFAEEDVEENSEYDENVENDTDDLPVNGTQPSIDDTDEADFTNYDVELIDYTNHFTDNVGSTFDIRIKNKWQNDMFIQPIIRDDPQFDDDITEFEQQRVGPGEIRVFSIPVPDPMARINESIINLTIHYEQLNGNTHRTKLYWLTIYIEELPENESENITCDIMQVPYTYIVEKTMLEPVPGSEQLVLKTLSGQNIHDIIVLSLVQDTLDTPEDVCEPKMRVHNPNKVPIDFEVTFQTKTVKSQSHYELTTTKEVSLQPNENTEIFGKCYITTIYPAPATAYIIESTIEITILPNEQVQYVYEPTEFRNVTIETEVTGYRNETVC